MNRSRRGLHGEWVGVVRDWKKRAFWVPMSDGGKMLEDVEIGGCGGRNCGGVLERVGKRRETHCGPRPQPCCRLIISISWGVLSVLMGFTSVFGRVGRLVASCQERFGQEERRSMLFHWCRFHRQKKPHIRCCCCVGTTVAQQTSLQNCNCLLRTPKGLRSKATKRDQSH